MDPSNSYVNDLFNVISGYWCSQKKSQAAGKQCAQHETVQVLLYWNLAFKCFCIGIMRVLFKFVFPDLSSVMMLVLEKNFNN